MRPIILFFPLLLLLACGGSAADGAESEDTATATVAAPRERPTAAALPFGMNGTDFRANELVLATLTNDSTVQLYDAGADGWQSGWFAPTDTVKLFSYTATDTLRQVDSVGGYMVTVFRSATAKGAPYLGFWQQLGDSLALQHIHTTPDLGNGATDLLQVIDRPQAVVVAGKTLYGYGGAALGTYWVGRYSKTDTTFKLLYTDDFAYRNGNVLTTTFALDAGGQQLVATRYLVPTAGEREKVSERKISLEGK